MARRRSRPRICSSKYIVCLSDAKVRRSLFRLSSLSCDPRKYWRSSIKRRTRRQSLASRARIKSRINAPSERCCSAVCACKSPTKSIRIIVNATRTACFTPHYSNACTPVALAPPLRRRAAVSGLCGTAQFDEPGQKFRRCNGSYSSTGAQIPTGHFPPAYRRSAPPPVGCERPELVISYHPPMCRRARLRNHWNQRVQCGHPALPCSPLA